MKKSNIKPNNVIAEINERGYCALKSFFDEEFINSISEEMNRHQSSINVNGLHAVWYKARQLYFNQLLTISKNFFNFVTSRFVFDICKGYLGNTFRLKASRYYETHGRFQMQWHTNNKQGRAFKDIPGLIFIFYITDVTDGEFQYVEGSHLWSGEKAYSDYSNDFIEQNYQNKVRSFRLPKGSLLIYNTYGIHRAKPSANNKFKRASVFFQIDADKKNAEPFYLNPKFLKNLSASQQQILGFGEGADNILFPQTNLYDLPITLSHLRSVFVWPLIRFVHFIYELIPRRKQNRLKNLIKR